MDNQTQLPELQPGEQILIVNPEKLALVARRDRGAAWFKVVGFWAIVNTLLVFGHAPLRFVFALGITEMVSLLARHMGTGSELVSLLFSGLGAAGAYFFARMASRGQDWAFVAGMVLYSLDLLIWAWFGSVTGNWLETVAHCYALYRMYDGLAANRLLRARFPR